MHIVFFVCALASIAAVVLICLFLFANGIPAMKEIGLLNFLTGAKWKPGNDIYGILPMILGSIYITAGAVAIGVPVGLLTAIFMAFYCPKKLYGLLKPCTELLAGIPSIVYGFFGMVVIVPCIRTVAALFDVDISGSSILAASVLLGIMILPSPRPRCARYRPPTMRARSPWARVTSARSSRSCSRRRNPACSQALSSASAAPSARPWRSSWSQATSRA